MDYIKIRILFVILCCYFTKQSHAQVEVSEVFKNDFIVCDFFNGSNRFTEMYLDQDGLIFNFGLNGKVMRLNPEFNFMGIKNNTHEVFDIAGNTLETIPSVTETRFQVLDSFKRKLIITKELDIDTPSGDCYDPEFEVIDFIGDEINHSVKKLEMI